MKSLAYLYFHVDFCRSRHIIQGRALNLRYPMQRLRVDQPLQSKNRQLAGWLQAQFAQRAARYYAEATYQFDE